MAQGKFDPCFTFTLGEEGRYSDSHNDPGSWSSGEVGVGTFIGTCWGISAPTLIDWVGPKHAHEVTAAYMSQLPIVIAKSIYLRDYWAPVYGDLLPAGVDLVVWDFAVNAGVKRSAEMLQQVVGVKADGFIGPATLTAVNRMQPKDIIVRVLAKHEAFYRSLPTFKTFGHGWMARQGALEAAAKEMVTPAKPIKPTPKGTPDMSYRFADRAKEWTSYAGVAAAALAAAIPHLIPAGSEWIQAWQGIQMLVGAALIFIPQTAGTTAVENDAWALLRAFSQKVPPDYAPAMQPLLGMLASHLTKAATGMPATLPQQQQQQQQPVAQPAPIPSSFVLAQPVPTPQPQPQPQTDNAPLVADPSAALRRFG